MERPDRGEAVDQPLKSMRILVVSNLYPPRHVGGYELCCQEAVDGLRKRGHEVCVLTSTYGAKKPQEDGQVLRWLQVDIGREETPFQGRAVDVLTRTIDVFKKEWRNFRAFRRAAKMFKPDLVYLWNLTHISVSVGMQAQRAGLPTCYYIGDLWLSNWRSDRWLSLGSGWFPPASRRMVYFVRGAARFAAKISGLPCSDSLDLRHVQFASEYLKNETVRAGEPVGGADVLHWGIDLEMFPFKTKTDAALRLLFVGQVVPHKGLDTAIEALRILVQNNKCDSLRLTIVGGSVYPHYVAELRARVVSLGLEKNVEFVGAVARERLPQLYREHDILLFPSLVDEGLGMSILEAMASGLVVLGTASGGSGETLIHERTGLVFPKEDASTCAAHVLHLMKDRSLYESLRHGARRAVEGYFEMGRLMNDLERSLQATLASREAAGFR